MGNRFICSLEKDKHYGIGINLGVTPENNGIIGEPKAVVYFSIRFWRRELWVELHLM